ncbi:hypothetical protein [Actinacidiphila acidipaludis]|uniref:Uncharacterized protein n=1 Tax=Actinacidiphila acidipaludis TaxID=2873382 RepID=A0ABS7QGC1_9ACTN|nr:hypothetical protein [Streptomyces acidipaludis]MBY8882205.1 hypothetical protein [Streptomyces acidipaludis]
MTDMTNMTDPASADEVKDAMTRALRGEAGGAPDLAAILVGGRRRRRAFLGKAVLGAAVLAVAGLGVGYGVTHGRTGAQQPDVAPAPAGQARTPSPPPHDNSHANLDRTHAAVRAALAGRLPAGMTLEDGDGPAVFRLVRSDGTVTSLGAEVGYQNLAGMPNPCTGSRYNTDCRPVSLADGSRGWAWETDAALAEGHAVSVAVYTQDGQAWGLEDSATEVDPATSKLEKGRPLTEDQLISLVSDPQVMAALKQVPTDQLTSTQTGRPYHL